MLTPTPAVTYAHASLVEYATPASPFLRCSMYQWHQQSSQLQQCGMSLRSRLFRRRWRFHCYRPSTRWSIPFCAGRTGSTGTGGTGGDCGGAQDRSACVFRQPRIHASNCPVVDCCVSPHGSDYQVRQEIVGLNHQRSCATGMCSVYSKYTKRPTSMASVLTDLTTKPAIKLLVGPTTTMCERNMLSEFRVHSSIPMSEPSVLIGLRTESAKKLLLAASGGGLGSRGKESQTAWTLCAWTSVDRGVRRHCSL